MRIACQEAGQEDKALRGEQEQRVQDVGVDVLGEFECHGSELLEIVNAV